MGPRTILNLEIFNFRSTKYDVSSGEFILRPITLKIMIWGNFKGLNPYGGGFNTSTVALRVVGGDEKGTQ
jgi:hypothetical protein